MTPLLVLFDIDGTLLRSQGAGMKVMQQAFHEVYPQASLSVDGVPVAGRLDSLIWADVLRAGGLDPAREDEAIFRQRYTELFRERIAGGIAIRQMPGVEALVAALAERTDTVVGLLTGNWQATARMKVAAAGFDPQLFRLGAYAGDGPDRRSLPPVAMERFRAAIGRPAPPDRVVIIGDTPADVDCAAFNGCRSLAVATGDYDLATLAGSGADRAVADLSDLAATVDWLFAPA